MSRNPNSARSGARQSKANQLSSNSGTNKPKPSESSELDNDLEKLLARIPENAPPEIVESILASYSGPLPPPSMYRAYEDVLPGSADRILRMAEQEQMLRRRDNGWILLNDSLRVSGSVLVSLGLIGAAVAATYFGNTPVAVSLGISGIVGALFRELIKTLFK